jgi:urease accessory protein
MSYNATQLLHLLSLSSTALPIGAYCYSQGMETAIHQQLVVDEASCQAFIEEVLHLVMLRFELPLLKRMLHSYADEPQFLHWAQLYRASRETKELLAESQQLAFSLNAWIKEVLKLPVLVHKHLGFVPVYAQLCGRLGLTATEVLSAYSFSVLENQVLAAVKTLPLGQMSGQRILWHLQPQIAAVVEQALEWPDQDLSSTLPYYAMLSMQHETQYSRLFRS